MAQKIKITAGSLSLEAELFDTPTANAIADALPITERANRWGEEIYFAIPVNADLEADSRDVLEAGELGFWPTGNAFCIFFGPTPASKAGEIRAASNVNIIGKIQGDLSELTNMPSGAQVTIEAI